MQEQQQNLLHKLIDTKKFGAIRNLEEQPRQGAFGTVYFTDKFALKIVQIFQSPEQKSHLQGQIKESEEACEQYYNMLYNEREIEYLMKQQNSKKKSDHVLQLKDEIQYINQGQLKFAILPLERFQYDLYDYLRKMLPSFENKLKLTVDICKGIKNLHDQNIMHRDIKEKNILVKEENGECTAVIADFSLVHYVRRYNTPRVGSYMSNEQLQQANPDLSEEELSQSQIEERKHSQINDQVPYNQSVDLFSLGITLFKMFTNDSRRQLKYSEEDQKQFIQYMTQNCPCEELTALLIRCIGKNDRPTIDQMLITAEKALSIQIQSEVIEDMKNFQFRIFQQQDLERVKKLEQGQQNFIKVALDRGFKYFNAYLDGDLADRQNMNLVFDYIYKEFIMFMKYPSKITSGDCLDISERISNIYEKVHVEFNKSLDSQDKLFFEFLIGFAVVLRVNCICCAKLFVNSEMLSDIAKKSINEEFLDFENIMEREGALNNKRAQFWNSQYICLKIIQKIQRELFLGENQSLSIDEMEQKWAVIKQLMMNDVQLNGTFQNLCSLRYIPENDKYFLCFAQILHWRGFGGQGELLPSEENPYVKELIQYKDLSIRYVRKESAHFGGQQVLGNMFVPIIISVHKYYAKFLQFAGKRFFQENPNQEKMKTFDFGSGPQIPAVDPLVNIYKEKIEVVASDIDGHSFQGLLESGKAKYVTFLDLNYIKQNQEDFDQQLDSKNRPIHKFKDSIDLFTSRLVIHQCIDFNKGHDMLSYLLNYISYNLVVGGLFAWFDTGPMCYMQAPIIPGNLVDREGCVPTNIFRYIKEPEKIGVRYKQGYKVLMYIPQLLATSPDAYNLYGGLYMFRSFINVYLDEKEYKEFIENLINLQEGKNEKVFNDYIKAVLDKKFQGFVQEIDQHMNQE